MNKTIFYDTIRQTIFDGKIKKSQFNGIEAVLNEWQREQLSDLRWLAYILATAYHETASTMQPIEEYGKGKGRPYGKPDPVTGKTYYGRGLAIPRKLAQITWKFNYDTLGKAIGVDLVNHPEKALDMSIAVKILFKGMIDGLFTGKKLSNYFTAKKEDWTNARRIVNGTDKADLIASLAKKFYKALTA